MHAVLHKISAGDEGREEHDGDEFVVAEKGRGGKRSASFVPPLSSLFRALCGEIFHNKGAD